MRMIKERMSWKRAGMTALAVVLTGAIAAGCSTSTAAGPRTVKTSAVTKQSVDDKYEIDADIVASSQVPVVPKATGDVLEVLKRKGDYVEQGEVILRLDTKDVLRSKEKTVLSRNNLQAQLNKTREDVATNRGVLTNTVNKLQMQIADLEKTYNNVRNDYDAGKATKDQVTKTELQLNTAKIDLDTAYKQLANLDAVDPLASLKIQLETTEVSLQDIDKTLSDFEVKAPISGVITDLTPEVGVTVMQGTASAQIQQLNPVKIHADITESMLKYVQGLKEVPFTIPGSSAKLTGKATYLADVMSPQSKSFVLELNADNPDRQLKPGTRVKLQVGQDSKRDVPVAPNTSILKEGSDNYVFVLNGDQVEKRKVTVGRSLDSNREITEGLKEGEQLVVSGLQDLKDKEQVKAVK